MKTFRIISMIIMVMITLFFMVFAQIQRGYAEEAVKEVLKQKAVVDANVKVAEQLQSEAERQAAIARKSEAHVNDLIKQLEACRGN